MVVTIFKDINTVNEPNYITVQTAFDRIKSGRSKEIVTLVRSQKTKDEANEVKKKLPSVCFAGRFSKRNASSLIEASGLMVLDFDNIKSFSDLHARKLRLIDNKFIFATWISPGGNGLKALVKIADPKQYGEHFDALRDIFPDLDASGRDISRVCYESFDEDLYVNENSAVFTEIKKIEKIEMSNITTDDFKIFEKIMSWITSKGESFNDGNRNNFLYKVASACCRFGLREDQCLSFCCMDFLRLDNSFKKSEANQTIRSAYKANVLGSAEFSGKKLVEKVTRKEVQIQRPEITDINAAPRDVIFGNDVFDDAVKLWSTGYSSAEPTGVSELDTYFKWKRGDITLLSGIGNYGKSTFLKYLLLLKAIKTGSKSALFSPEECPAHEFYHDLVEMYLGCSCTPSNPDRPSLDAYTKAYDFVKEHFYFIYPKTISPSPEVIKESFLEMIIKHKVDFCVIDPFNQMTNDYGKSGGRSDKYLETLLADFGRFALENSIFFVIVAHPKQMVKNVTGNYPCPDVYDMADGAMWNNKMDNILVYHLPNRQTSPEDTTCEFHSKKIRRRKSVGNIGTLMFHYMPRKRRFIFNDSIDYIENELSWNKSLHNASFYEPQKNEEYDPFSDANGFLFEKTDDSPF